VEVAITKMAKNGQIVIPAEIRKKIHSSSTGKFIVYFDGNEIRLKNIEESKFLEEMDLLNRINKAEDEIKKGKVVKVDSNMSEKEIDELLMK